jgi:hypothetical protein
MVADNRLDLLREHLNDPACSVWFCPDCGNWINFGFVNEFTGTVSSFALACDECGFDATPYFIPEILTRGLPVKLST